MSHALNYDFLTKKQYRGSAKFSATGRMRQVSLYANDMEDCKNLLRKKGFDEPFEVVELPPEPATDSQIAFAHDLGLLFPADITKRDLSFLIDKTQSHDSDPNPGLLQYALNKGITNSVYIGKRELYNLIFATLNGQDKVAFFLFCVYRFCSNDRFGDLDTHPQSASFYFLANGLVSDQRFMDSMNKYDGASIRFFGLFRIKNPDGSTDEFTGGSVNTIAYKQAVQALQTKFNISQKTTRTQNDSSFRYAAAPASTSDFRHTAAHAPISGSNQKDKWIALCLCLFLGIFGAHKFYEGKVLMGVVYLFTLGLFFIGWICDLITLFNKPSPYYV